MNAPVIPVYALCGANDAERLAFFEQFCQTPHPLRVLFCPDAPVSGAQKLSLCIPEDTPLKAAGDQMARTIRECQPDSVWIDWEDDRPVQDLLLTMQAVERQCRCKLRKIVRCGSAAEVTASLSASESRLPEQLAQCDLLVLRGSDRREIVKTRRRILPCQPDIEVVAWEEAREVSDVLHGRNILQAVRFALILTVCAALLAIMSRFRLSIPNGIAVFLGTYLQALPFLLLGILLSSTIQVFVPADLLQRIFPKKLLSGMLFGVLGGFFLPVCDCASIPVFRSLIRKGVPLPAAVTFMIAAPVINPVVMLSTYYAFGGNVRIMFTRMGFGVVCSLLVGLCFAGKTQCVLIRGETVPDACGCKSCHGHASSVETPALSLKNRLLELLIHFRDEVFEVSKYLLIGIGVSTVLQLVMGSKLTGFTVTDLAQGMLLMMAMAFLLSLCSSSDAVVGKNMGASLPMGAVMSFLVFGPMIDVKNVILMSASFTKRFIIKMLIVTFTVSFVTVYAAFSLGLGALIA